MRLPCPELKTRIDELAELLVPSRERGQSEAICRDPTVTAATRCKGPIPQERGGTDRFSEYQTAMERVIR